MRHDVVAARARSPEVSMVDTDMCNSICECLSNADHSRRPDARDADCFGRVSLILLGGFK